MDTLNSQSNTISSEKTTLMDSNVQSLLQKFKEIVNIHNMRGLVLFTGMGESHPYNIPSKTDLIRRIKHNIIFYATNYAAVVVILAFVTIIMNPLFLFVLILLGGCWYYVAQLGDQDIAFMGHSLSGYHRSILMGVVTVALVFLFGGSVLFTISCISVFCVLCHAIFRNSLLPEDDEFGFLAEPQYVDSV